MFKVITGDMDSFVKNATDIHNDFEFNIKRLENLISAMEVSSAWRDNILKENYIAACKSHLARFKGLSKVMNGDIKYARAKAQRAEEITGIYRA
jgi:hypothetical protein